MTDVPPPLFFFFFFVTVVVVVLLNPDDISHGFVKLFDNQTYDLLDTCVIFSPPPPLLHLSSSSSSSYGLFVRRYALRDNEMPCSILSCQFRNDDNAYFCVGTAVTLMTEDEPSQVT